MDSAFQKVGVSLASRCALCKCEAESPPHLFIDCKFATILWRKLSAMLGFQLFPNESPLTRFRRLSRIFKRQSLFHSLLAIMEGKVQKII